MVSRSVPSRFRNASTSRQRNLRSGRKVTPRKAVSQRGRNTKQTPAARPATSTQKDVRLNPRRAPSVKKTQNITRQGSLVGRRQDELKKIQARLQQSRDARDVLAKGEQPGINFRATQDLVLDEKEEQKLLNQASFLEKQSALISGQDTSLSDEDKRLLQFDDAGNQGFKLRSGAQGVEGQTGFSGDNVQFARNAQTKALFTDPEGTSELLRNAGIDPLSDVASIFRALVESGETALSTSARAKLNAEQRAALGKLTTEDQKRLFRQFVRISSGEAQEQINRRNADPEAFRIEEARKRIKDPVERQIFEESVEAQRRSQREEEASRIGEAGEDEMDFSRFDALASDSLRNQVLSSIPEDLPGRDLLAASINAQIDAEDEIRNLSRGAFDFQAGRAEDMFADIESRLDNQEQRAQEFFNQAQARFEQSEDFKNKLFAQKESNDLEELAYLEEKQTRESKAALRTQLDEMTVTMALMGRAGSVSANNELEQAEFDGEQAILDLQREIGFKRSDVRAFYTEKYIESQDRLTDQWYTAKDALNSELGRIETQGIANTQLKEQSIQNAFNNFINTWTTSKRQEAKVISGAAQVIRTAISNERATAQAEKQRAFQELQWYKNTYGTNLPNGVKEDIQKRMPGFDVDSFLNTKTLAEERAAARKFSGSSFSSISFAPRETRSDGTALPVEDFINKRLADEGFDRTPDYSSEIAAEEQRLGVTMDASARAEFISALDDQRSDLEDLARHRFEVEYQSKKSELDRNDPQKIMDLAIDRTSGADVPLHTRENAIAQVENLLARGEYARAVSYIDGLGRGVSQTERKQYQSARQAKQSINRINELIDGLGAQGPVIGQFREANPFDDRVVELNQIITSSVPNLARGVFGEVGVLTDEDVRRYTGLIANTRLTKDQARTATRNLLETIDNNVRAQIDIQRASGLDVRELEQVFFDGASVEALNDRPIQGNEIDEILNSVYSQ